MCGQKENPLHQADAIHYLKSAIWKTALTMFGNATAKGAKMYIWDEYSEHLDLISNIICKTQIMRYSHFYDNYGAANFNNFLILNDEQS